MGLFAGPANASAGEAADDEGAESASADGSDAAATATDDGYPGMIGAGIGLLGVGLFGVGVGIGAIVGGGSTGHDYVQQAATGSVQPNDTGFPETSDPGLQIAGGIMLGIGGALALTGAILIPVGFNSEPPSDDEAVVVEPLLGPTHAGVRVRF